jgi:hypothetical protein
MIMQLQQNLQNLLSAAQGGTLRLAKLFLKENPDILKRYVSTSIGVMGTVLTPLNSVMKHLILLQDIDINTVPGERARKELSEGMSAAFENYHQKDYDDDYNFDWIQKRFEATQKELRQLNLSKEKFVDLTDVSKLPGGFKNETSPFVVDRFPTISTESQFFAYSTEVNPVAPESEKRELPLDTRASTFDPITDLSNVMSAIENRSNKKPTKKTGLKPVKKSANKKILAVSKRRGTAGATKKSNDLINKMIAKGSVGSEPKNVAAQIEEITKWDENATKAVKDLVEKGEMKKGPKKEFTGSFKRAR